MASIRTNARKVVCIGRNYADHIAELSNQRPKQPFFFLKPPSSILPPHAGPVLAPRGVQLHYEVELGLIMGREARDLREEDEEGCLGAIDAYCLSIDMTARNVQDEAKRKGLPWSIAKGFDTFCPVSAPLPASDIRDPHALTLSLRVNDSLRQHDRTDLMLFRIPRILADISKVMTLERGDLVLTGTPKGVGRVEVGDVMRAELGDGNGHEKGDDGKGEGSVGKVLAEIEVGVQEKGGLYEFKET